MTKQTRHVVLVDAENIFIGWEQNMGYPLNFQWVINYLQNHLEGDIKVIAFGVFEQNGLKTSIKDNLTNYGVEVIDTSSSRSAKPNQSDFFMLQKLTELLLFHQDLENYVLMTGDHCFGLTIAMMTNRLQKKVTICANKAVISGQFKKMNIDVWELDEIEDTLLEELKPKIIKIINNGKNGNAAWNFTMRPLVDAVMKISGLPRESIFQKIVSMLRTHDTIEQVPDTDSQNHPISVIKLID